MGLLLRVWDFQFTVLRLLRIQIFKIQDVAAA